MTPLVGIGLINLEQMLPLTLGANVGTTITALMAALLSDANAMQVALAHVWFNITGIVIWYPIPFMRRIPLHAARQLGKGTRIWKGFPFAYIGVMFFAVPILFLGISTMFTQDSKGLTVLGIFVVCILFLVICWTVYHCKYRGGQQKCYECMVNRQTRRQMMETLPEDMEFLKAKVKELAEHTGLPEAEETPEVPEAEVPLTKEDSAQGEGTDEEAA